jgi:hypothetical protein
MGFTRLTPSKPTIAAISGFCSGGRPGAGAVVRPANRDRGLDARLPRAPLGRAADRRRHPAPAAHRGPRARARPDPDGAHDRRAEALSMGLLTEVVPAGAHLERALALAEGLARFPQRTMLADRRAAIEGLGMTLARVSRSRQRPDPRCSRMACAAPRASPPARAAGARAPGRSQNGIPICSLTVAYFVTGATGFIGRRLVERLLNQRQGKMYVLVREGSKGRLDDLIERWGSVAGASGGQTRAAGDRRSCASRCWGSSRSR